MFFIKSAKYKVEEVWILFWKTLKKQKAPLEVSTA